MNTKHIFLFFILGLILKTTYAQELKLGLPVGHTSYATSANFSPDGKTVVTASKDNTACIWEVTSGKLLQTLKGHFFWVNSANFSPDGKTVVTASEDNTARIWEVASGKLLQTLKGHTSRVNSANYSPDGKTIITASMDNTARIWEAASGKLLQTLKKHSNNVYSANFSPDGKTIVTASEDNTARIWNVASGKLLQTLKGHTSSVNSANYSPDGKTVLTASHYDNTVRIWDAVSAKPLQTLKRYINNVNSANYSPDGKTVITASSDSASRIWDVASGKLLQILEGHSKRVNSAVFSSDGKTVLTASEDNTARIWNVASGKLLQTLKGHTSSVYSANFSADGKTVLTASYDNTARIWEVTSGKLLQTLEGHTDRVSSGNFSADGKTMVTVIANNPVRIWDVASGKLLQTLEGHTAWVNSAVFSSDGKTVLTASADKTARIWDSASGKLLQTLEGHASYVESAVFSSDGKTVLTASWDETARIWDVASGKLLQTLKGHSNNVNSANFSPDGKIIVTASEDNTARIWNVASGKLLQTLKRHSRPVNSANFSADGKTVITASRDETARIWDVASGKQLKKLEGHTYFVNSAIYSPDGKTVLTASEDNTARIWNVTSGKPLQTLGVPGNYGATGSPDPVGTIDIDGSSGLRAIQVGHTSSVNSANFSADGKTVLTSSDDGSIIFWDKMSGELLVQHFLFDSDPNKWVHLHPSGLFDASPEAMELMYWTKGLEIIEFSQLKDRYWLPGLWEKVMKGEPLPDTRNMQELKLQPEVELGEVKDGKIAVTLTKREGGYGKVSILINGKEIQADARGEQFDKTKETQTVWVDLKDHPNLQNGENTIAVKASSEDGFVVGRPIEKKVTMSFQTAKPHFYAVVIGTGKYMNSSINLKYPEKDAESMSTALKLGSEQLFGKENTHIYTLTTSSNERPTKEKIKSVFTEIGKTAKSSDVILVYLSGHGITWGGDQSDFYYVTTDATAANSEAYNDELLRKNHLISTAEFTEYLKVIPANKQVMIIDACSSGKAVENLMASRDIDVSQIKAIDRMKDRTGMFVISGSAADAVSYEASRYGQGLLTYSILQAMKGAALRDGQFFDVNTILNYSRENVPRLAAGIGGIQTPQLLIPKGGSFDIGQVDEESKKQIPLSNIKPVFVRTVLVDDNSDDDDLNLSKLLDEQLNETAMRGKDAQLVFLDTREFPDAYRLRGSYTQNNGIIALKLRIKGPKESEHLLTGDSKEIILEKIIEIVEGIE